MSKEEKKTLSDAELIGELERLSRWQIKSRSDFRGYVDSLSAKARERRSSSQRLKNSLLAALLVAAFAQYYFIDVQLQILAQPSLTVFVPAKVDPAKPYLGG
jgi:hypothetical protein